MEKYVAPLASSFALGLLFALQFYGCSSTTETVASSEQPSIRSLSNDTVAAGSSVTVYGYNLAFSRIWLGDLEVQTYDSIYSNYINFIVPTDGTTNYVYVSTDGIHRAQSPKKLVVESANGTLPMYVSDISRDSVSVGERVVLYGRSLLRARDSVALLLNSVSVPIDEFYDDSLVFHVPTEAITGTLQLVGQTTTYFTRQITLMKPVVWRHCTISIVGFEYDAYHRRTGTVDHGRQIDSTWIEHRTLNWSRTIDLSVLRAMILQGAYYYYIAWGPLTFQQSSLALYWNDTAYSYAGLSIYGHSSAFLPVSTTDDTTWTFQYAINRTEIDPNGSSHILIPFGGMSGNPTISESHSDADHNGEHNWTERVSMGSQAYGVGRLTIDLMP